MESFEIEHYTSRTAAKSDKVVERKNQKMNLKLEYKLKSVYIWQ